VGGNRLRGRKKHKLRGKEEERKRLLRNGRGGYRRKHNHCGREGGCREHNDVCGLTHCVWVDSLCMGF